MLCLSRGESRRVMQPAVRQLVHMGVMLQPVWGEQDSWQDDWQMLGP